MVDARETERGNPSRSRVVLRFGAWERAGEGKEDEEEEGGGEGEDEDEDGRAIEATALSRCIE